MWGRSAIILSISMVLATALTLIGTYYLVEWVSPPMNMYGNAGQMHPDR
jgi:hypothetical protein